MLSFFHRLFRFALLRFPLRPVRFPDRLNERECSSDRAIVIFPLLRDREREN